MTRAFTKCAWVMGLAAAAFLAGGCVLSSGNGENPDAQVNLDGGNPFQDGSTPQDDAAPGNDATIGFPDSTTSNGCSQLEACCATLQNGTNAASCNDVAATNDQAECADYLPQCEEMQKQGGGADAATGTDASAPTCPELQACCATLNGTNAANCEMVADMNNDSECIAYLPQCQSEQGVGGRDSGIGSNCTGESEQGTPCGPGGGGQICFDGVCEPGCYIDGMFYNPGQGQNSCVACMPAMSTSSWTDMPAGSGCAGGVCCQADAGFTCCTDGVP